MTVFQRLTLYDMLLADSDILQVIFKNGNGQIAMSLKTIL